MSPSVVGSPVAARAGAARVTRAEDLPRHGEGALKLVVPDAHAIDLLDLRQVGLRRLHESDVPPGGAWATAMLEKSMTET